MLIWRCTFIMKLPVYPCDELAECLRGLNDDVNVSEVCQVALARALSIATVAGLGDVHPSSLSA